MLCRTRSGEQLDSNERPKRRFGMFAKMGSESAPYLKMGEDTKKKNDKENAGVSNGEKKKKKKKGWKRIRQAALTTCRYIGLGATGLSPGFYNTPEYSSDPKYWNKSFNTSAKYKPAKQSSAWVSGMMIGGWY